MVWVLEKLPALLTAELALFCGKGSRRPLHGLCQACVPARQPLASWRNGMSHTHEYTE